MKLTKQNIKAFTLAELITLISVIIIGIFIIGILGGSGYIAWHFIQKIW